MNRFYLYLSMLALCQVAIGAPSPKSANALASEETLYQEKYNHLKHTFNDVLKAKDVSDYQLSSQNQKLAHILAFSDLQTKSLESRNSELAKEKYAQDKALEAKNNQIESLFKEIHSIRTMLRDSLTTRNNLERAYLNLDQKLQITQQNYLAQNKHLNHKLIDLEAARTTSLMNEGKALQQAASLELALKENEKFYTQDMYKIFDSLAYELEETKKQLNVATEACFEGDRELTMVKKQLEAAQSLLANGGVSAKSEKELKTIQATLAKLGKEALDVKGSYQAQLSQALEHIKTLDKKINKAQLEAEKNQQDIQQRAAREAKYSQDFKNLSADLTKIKSEYQSQIAQNTLQFTKTIKTLEHELQTTKAQASRSAKTLQAKDMAFGTLERHSKNLQALVSQEETVQKKLVKELHNKDVELKNTQAKLARAQTTENTLRTLVDKTQQELKLETHKSKQFAHRLNDVSKKLASTELSRDKALFESKKLSAENADLSQKLAQSEANAFVLAEERNNYMFERHAFARTAQKAVEDRNIFANRYETLLKTVSRAHENSKLGVNADHPAGVAIV